jgi:hypothetical protein
MAQDLLHFLSVRVDTRSWEGVASGRSSLCTLTILCMYWLVYLHGEKMADALSLYL